MRTLATFGMFLALLVISQQDLLACSCARIPPVCEAVWKADSVFVGTVIKIEPPSIFGIPLAWPLPTENRVTFAVKEQFGGLTQKTIEVRTSSGCCACGMEFHRGSDYLVYAYRNAGTGSLHTGVCTRTALAANSAQDLGYLRSLKSSTPPAARVYGFVTNKAWDLRMGDKATEPLAGVPVHLRRGANEWQTVTDENGAYEFRTLRAGTYSLFANLTHGLSAGETRVISLPEYGCSQQLLLALEQAQVSGRIIVDSGPSIQTFVALVPVSKGVGKPAEGFSAADGTFNISHVAPGDYYLGVNISEPPRDSKGLSAPWQPTYYPGVQSQQAATQIHVNSAQQLQGFEFHLPPRLKQRTITGFVHWSNGKPAMAFVELKDDSFDHNVDLGNSRADGSFTVTGVVDRPYSISAVTGIGEGETPVHSPKVKLGLSTNGPIDLVLSIPGRN